MKENVDLDQFFVTSQPIEKHAGSSGTTENRDQCEQRLQYTY